MENEDPGLRALADQFGRGDQVAERGVGDDRREVGVRHDRLALGLLTPAATAQLARPVIVDLFRTVGVWRRRTPAR